MRILIDIQSLQGDSKYRGIGRYVSNLVTNMINTKNKDDEIYLLYNDWDEKTQTDIINKFKNLIPSENLIKFYLPFKLHYKSYWFPINEYNIFLIKQAELLREYIISKVKPDFVLISSHFELIALISSISSNFFEIPTGVITYDFLPKKYPKDLLPNKWQKDWYNSKTEYIKKSNLLLCISDFIANEAKEFFKDENIDIQSISTASSDFWKKIEYSQEDKDDFKEKYKITKPFILYTGGSDKRKNITSLIKAFSSLKTIKKDYQLLVVLGKVGDKNLEKELHTLSKKERLIEDKDIIFAGYVSDEDMRMMYNLCSLFVFPSLGEGFGLTPLEAMQCGATVITSNSTSLPEVVGLEESMFDPTSVESISNKINEVLTDKNLYEKIKNNANKRTKLFSWEETAKKAWINIRNCVEKSTKSTEELSEEKFFEEATKVFSKYKDIKDFKSLLHEFSTTVELNNKKEQKHKIICIDTNLISNNEIIGQLPKQIDDFEINYVEVLTDKKIGTKNIETGKIISYNIKGIYFLNLNIFNNDSIKNHLNMLKLSGVKFLYTNHKCLFGNDDDFDKLSKEDKEKAVKYFKKSIEIFSKLLTISEKNEMICLENIYVN